MQGAKGNSHHSADKADDIEHHAEVRGGQLHQEGLGVHVQKGAAITAQWMKWAKRSRSTLYHIHNMCVQRALKLRMESSI